MINNREKELVDIVKEIDGFLTSHEGLFLYWAVKDLSHTSGQIVEIGSWKGKSTVFLDQASKETSSLVFAIDPHRGVRSVVNKYLVSGSKYLGNKKSTFDAFRENIENAGVKDFVSPVVATSEEAVKKWNKPIKLLFIDGLHDYKNCLFDFNEWSKFLVDGGIVALHDSFCMWEGPKRVVFDKLLKNNGIKTVGVVNSITYAVYGKPTLIDSFYKRYCAALIILANEINSLKKLPWIIKLVFIHRLIRLMLLNKFTKRFLVGK